MLLHLILLANFIRLHKTCPLNFERHAIITVIEMPDMSGGAHPSLSFIDYRKW